MIYIGIAAGIFLLELFLKNHIEKTKKEKEVKAVCKGKLLLRKYHNEGAFLNAGERVRPLVACLSLFLTLVITGIFIVTVGQKGKKLLKTGLAFMLGGAFSNTYDRLARKYVVDYFSFNVRWAKLRNVVFNTADFCIVIGAVLSVIGGNKT